MSYTKQQNIDGGHAYDCTREPCECGGPADSEQLWSTIESLRDERDRLRAEVAEWQNRFQMEEHALAASESLSNELRWANEASLAALAEARGLLVRWLGHSREFQPYADTSAFLGRTAPPPEFGCRFESCPGHYVENEECAVTEAARTGGGQ